MADVQKTVETKFTVNDETVSKMGMLKESFSSMGQGITEMIGKLGPLNSAVSQIADAASFKNIMKAGSEFENLSLGLAQTMQFMGEGGKTFQDSMKLSEGFMKRIVADAGPLPGNAMDYANAMQLAGSAAQRATGNFEDSYKLVRNMTAVSITLGGNAQLAATELNRMLNPMKGMMHEQGDFNQKILASFRQLPGYANITSKEFNKFDLHKRLELVKASLKQYQPMVDESSKSWDNIKGATEANVSLLTKMAGQPVFDLAKASLSKFNDLLLDSQGELKPLGNLIVNGIKLPLEAAISVGQKFFGMFETFAGSSTFTKIGGLFSNVFDKVMTLPRIIDAGASKPGGRDAEAGSAAIGLITGGPMGALISASVTAFMSHTDALNSVIDSLSNIFTNLWSVVSPLIDVFFTVAEFIGSAMADILPSVMRAVDSIIEAIAPIVTGFIDISMAIYEKVQPVFHSLFKAVGDAVESVGTLLGGTLKALGDAFLWIYEKVSGFLEPVISVTIYALEGFVDAIKWVADKIVWLINQIPGVTVGLQTAKATERNKDTGESNAHAMIRRLARGPIDLNKSGKEIAALFGFGPDKGGGGMGATPEARGGGGRTVQDFRFSKFDITQKFAEGFDPDRIAVMFARDVAKVGELKLGSQFDPKNTGR